MANTLLFADLICLAVFSAKQMTAYVDVFPNKVSVPFNVFPKCLDMSGDLLCHKLKI